MTNLAKFSSYTKSRSKYGNKRVGSHASKKEHYRAAELKIMQRAGLISDLREQVSYELIPTQYGECGKNFSGRPTRILLERACRYVADFVYTDCATGQTIVEDTKGVRTKEYIIKRKLMLHVHNIRIKEI